MTTKQECENSMKEKYNLKKDKFKQIWAEKEEEMKKRGHEGEELLKRTIRRVNLFLRKSGGETLVQIVPIGYASVTDYGAQKMYDEALEKYQADPALAVKERYVKPDGTPIFRNHAFKSGKEIIPAREKSRMMYAVAKREEDTIWKPCMMNMNGDILEVRMPELGMAYEIKAGVSKKTQDKYQGKRLILYSTENSSFGEGQKISKDIQEFIKEHMGNFIIEFEDIRTKAKSDEGYDNFYIFKSDVVSSTPTMPGSNNKMVLAIPSEDGMNVDEITGWAAEELPLNIRDEAMDVICIGRGRFSTRQSETGEEEVFQLDLFGWFATDPIDVKTPENTPEIKSGNNIKDGTVEESIADTPVKKPAADVPPSEEKKEEPKKEAEPEAPVEEKKEEPAAEAPKEEKKEEAAEAPVKKKVKGW